MACLRCKNRPFRSPPAHSSGCERRAEVSVERHAKSDVRHRAPAGCRHTHREACDGWPSKHSSVFRAYTSARGWANSIAAAATDGKIGRMGFPREAIAPVSNRMLLD